MKLSKNLTFLPTKILSFHKFNDYLLFTRLNTIPVSHLKINENKNVMEGIQNRDWQYLVESVALYMRSLGQFSNILLFFYKDILYKKA